MHCWSGANSKINKGLYVMLFKIVILATYIFKEGPWPAPITEHLGGYTLRPAQLGSNYTSVCIRWFRRRRYQYPTGRPGCNPRGDRANKNL